MNPIGTIGRSHSWLLASIAKSFAWQEVPPIYVEFDFFFGVYKKLWCSLGYLYTKKKLEKLMPLYLKYRETLDEESYIKIKEGINKIWEEG